MKQAQRKDLLRELRHSMNRYLSILLIMALGVAFYAGVRSSEPDMQITAKKFYDDTDFMDIRVVGTMGMTEDDVEAIAALEGVDAVEGAYRAEVFLVTELKNYQLSVYSIGERVNRLNLTAGRLPEAADECVMDEFFFASSGYQLGDTIVLAVPEEKELSDTLHRDTYTIVGAGTYAEYLSWNRGTVSIGTGSADAFLFLPKEAFAAEVYSGIYLTVKGAKDYNCFQEDYEALVDKVQERIESIEDARCAIRFEEATASAREEIADAEAELADARAELADAKKEIADAKEELAKAKEDLENGRQEVSDGKAELEEKKAEFADAEQKIADGEQELEDGRQALADASEELESKKTELADAKEQYKAGEEEFAAGKMEYEENAAALEEAKEQYAAGAEELAAGRGQYEANAAELAAAKEKLEDGRTQLAAAKAQYEEGQTELTAARVQYEEGKEKLAAAKVEYEAGQKKLAAAKAQYEAGLAELEAAKKQLAAYGLPMTEELAAAEVELTAQGGLLAASEAEFQEKGELLAASEAELAAQGELLAASEAEFQEKGELLAASEEELTAQGQTLAAAEEELAAAEQTLLASEAEFAAKGEELSAAEEELLAAAQTLKDGEAELAEKKQMLDDADRELADAEQTLTEKKAELADAEEELVRAKAELEDGRQAILDAETELADAEAELADGEQKIVDAEQEIADGEREIADGEQEIADGEAELADAKRELAEVEAPEWYVLDRNTVQSFVEYGMDAERIGLIGKVFPAVFYLVATLVSLTTMTRMVEEERTQIGTMKALGYGKASVASKYLWYSLSASVLGGLLGIAVGSYVLPQVIIGAYKILYTHLPPAQTPIQWELSLFSLLIAVFCTTAATGLACGKELAAPPSVLMRPAAPKEGKRVFLEHITPLWRMFSFSWKATCRNLFRYKKRLFMTVFGIGGCMGLLMVAFGLRDSIGDIVENQYKNIWTYDAYLSVNDAVFTEAELEAMDDVTDSMYVRQVMIDIAAGTAEKEIRLFVPERLDGLPEFLKLGNRVTGEEYRMTEEGAVISEKLARIMGVSIGDTIYIKEDETTRHPVTITTVVENYLYHYVYLSKGQYEALFGEEPEYNQLFLKLTDMDEEEKEAFAAAMLADDSVDSITYITDLQRQVSDMMNSLNLVVVVLIVSAAMLAFIVLYNLNNINIIERRRELATIKVLGFYDEELAMYVYRENILLTVFGIGVGVIIGYFLHRFVIETCEIDMIMFGRDISGFSYTVSIALTVLFSVAVNLGMFYKLRRIDMVESLKSME